MDSQQTLPECKRDHLYFILGFSAHWTLSSAFAVSSRGANRPEIKCRIAALEFFVLNRNFRCIEELGTITGRGRLKVLRYRLTAWSLLLRHNQRVASRYSALPIDVRSDKSVVTPTCLECFFLSCTISLDFSVSESSPKEIIVNYSDLKKIKIEVERVMCFVCPCWLAKCGLLVKSRRHWR